ncbi:MULTISPECIES: hypothetical protein [unclassified Streptomyces]|uniref:hypothetical protein n=1 Tax=unclassified Streptomyces TaxID=2593676 RepID=UPI002E823A0B|nr:hypothetical protein [Streptomyces sp. NBC_00589]WTI40404.1 hypothetical protein OIC96_38140 [Streptomyces sp. NBC_00775]WUB25912.1 hypothetical protein OHA51_11590 [Streptomyces sp. NBC_00589]
MSTSSLPCRPGTRRRASALVALAVAGTAMLGAPAAFAAPGDNGDVKVHDSHTAVNDQRDDPKVCQFYLDGFDFDGAQKITWSIETQPHVDGGATLAGGLTIPASGDGRTAGLFSLPKGQYKLTWNFEGESGAGKQKVFRVDCRPGGPTSTPTPPKGGPGGPGGGPGGPHGGPHAGGGGLAHIQDFSPVVGAAAAGLVMAGGVVYLRLRRRPDGAA